MGAACEWAGEKAGEGGGMRSSKLFNQKGYAQVSFSKLFLCGLIR